MNKLFIDILLATTSALGHAEKYVTVQEVVGYSAGQWESDMGGTGTYRGSNVQSRTISCTQLGHEVAMLEGMLGNLGTGSPQYQATYSKWQNFRRVFVYQCQ